MNANNNSNKEKINNNKRPFIASKVPPIFISYGIRKNQCSEVIINNKKKYARIEIQDDVNMKNVKYKLEQKYNLYNKNNLLNGPDGVYTWIYGDKGFYAIKTRNITEIATLHMSLATRTESEKIYLSGELLKTDDKIVFNILSGNYMAPLSKKLKNNSILKASAKKLFNNMGFNASLQYDEPKTFIVEESLPLTIDDLLDYKMAGFKITLYDSKEECIIGK
jgi:hypothetical protein